MQGKHAADMLHFSQALDELRMSVKSLQEDNASLRAENEHLRKSIAASTPPTFSVAQYNVLAGYLGNNMEPWFLYGIVLDEDKRARIKAKHQERDESGKPRYAGWPNYVRDILTPDEIRVVERVHRLAFDWETRRERLLQKVLELDSDVISLVECDHFQDRPDLKPTCWGHDPSPGFWSSRMAEHGYKGVWEKRPRATSHDGCAVFWRTSVFEQVAWDSVQIVDKVSDGQTHADRICVAVLLRMRNWNQKVMFVSTHLARNPEERRQEWLRARQIGQVMRFIARFATDNGALQAPVVIAGDMNSSNFCRVRGLAEAMLVLRGDVTSDQIVHPMLFEARDVPTGATSITDCRNVRIDAILYQRRALALREVMRLPSLTDPIPQPEHPSDHLPIKAVFAVISDMSSRGFSAQSYVKTLLGIDVQSPLNGAQLRDVFLYFDWNGRGAIDRESLLRSLCELDIGLRESEQDKVVEILLQAKSCPLPEHGEQPPTSPSKLDLLFLEDFQKVYVDALQRRLPQRKELEWAFSMMDSDRDGRLTLGELKECFLVAFPFELPPGHIEEIFSRIDIDKDGIISFDEFLQHSASSYGCFWFGSPPRSGAVRRRDSYAWASCSHLQSACSLDKQGSNTSLR